MRILHLDSGREMRGGQWQALRLHEGLLDAGHDSLLLTPEDAPLFREARLNGLPCEVLRPLRLALQSRAFDLVHAHDARSHTIAALFSRSPVAVSRRVAFPVRDSALSRWKYSRPQIFLAVSGFVGAQLREAGVAPNRIRIVHDGVPLPAAPARGDAILIPHTLDNQKGMALAEQGAALAGIEVKRTHDLARDLPAARALLYLSRSEGLGSGILLGMAHGVTVIASDIGGIPELIEDGVNGLLVPNEVSAIAASFRRIDPRLGTAARETVGSRFTEAHMLEATLGAYSQVIA